MFAKPSRALLHDHGLGCNWRDFGGDSPMYRIARAAGALPPLLLNTRVWDGYTAVAEPMFLAGQMHRHERRLYQLHDGGGPSEWGAYSDGTTDGVWN